MTIKDAEKKTGLPRSNIRFYEKEELINPERNESNGYREYSEKDICDIKKIACLRTIGIPIESIRSVMKKKVTLHEVLEKQSKELEGQIAEANRTKAMCDKMLNTENLDYENLEVDDYISQLPEYWNDNRQVFKLDAVSFLYIWGNFIVWLAITIFCLLTGLLAYPKLPPQIPVQWSGGVAVSQVNKEFIFIYPAACIIIRYLLRICIYSKLQINVWYKDILAEYLTNFLCFLALSVEVFSILFVYGAVNNILVMFGIDAAVFAGLLIMAIRKMRGGIVW